MLDQLQARKRKTAIADACYYITKKNGDVPHTEKHPAKEWYKSVGSRSADFVFVVDAVAANGKADAVRFDLVHLDGCNDA